VHKVGFTNHIVDGKCVYEPIKCKQGEHLVGDKCEKINCPPDTDLVNSVCVKVIKKVVNRGGGGSSSGSSSSSSSSSSTTIINNNFVETIFRNVFVNPNQPAFLLLLYTAQLCQLAGDTQCVAKQNQFTSLNLVTKLDSTGRTWTITGQVENGVAKIQNNVQVTAYFYDSKGNSVGGPYKGAVNPAVLKSLQLGVFSMKPSTSIMKGAPSFIRLEYQSTTS
jgi:hypothetical protein